MEDDYSFGSSLDDLSMPFAHSSYEDAELEALAEVERQQKRLLQSRKYAKVARNKKKQKVNLLESQVAQLTEEVNRLSAAAADRTLSFPKNKFTDAIQETIQALSTALANPQTTDDEMTAILDKASSLFVHKGTYRLEALANTFQHTVDMMVPAHVKFCFWACELGPCMKQFGPVNWEEIAASSHLTAEQLALIQKTTLEQEKTGVIESFLKMRKMTGKIVGHAEALHSMLSTLKEVLQPRQAAMLGLWMFKNYSCLEADKVLNYGHSSIDVLNCE